LGLRNPEQLGAEVLAADRSFLRVLVLDKTGGELAHVYSRNYPPKARLGKETEEKYGFIDILFLETFAQEEKSYGKMNFILLVFETAKVMLMQSRKEGVYLAARIPRAANAEYLFTKVKPILNAGSRLGSPKTHQNR
jgi:hypothetical protein